jgi:hypothetical protein
LSPPPPERVDLSAPNRKVRGRFFWPYHSGLREKK